MNTQKIYVQLLDGSTVWALMNAQKLGENRFKILEEGEYLDFDLDEWPLYLFEFWPGDIVELKPHTFSDGHVGQVASELIERGHWPQRKLAEFKFKATLGQLEINQETANNFREEIERVKTGNLSGQLFYPVILETIEKLEKLKTKKGLHKT